MAAKIEPSADKAGDVDIDMAVKEEDHGGSLNARDSGKRPRAPQADDLNASNFVSVSRGYFEDLLQFHGGPTQYLMKRAKTEEKRMGLGEELSMWFPERQDLMYHHEGPLPRDSNIVFPLRLKDLAFGPACSPKPFPFLATSLALVDEILTHGFITQSHSDANCFGT